MELAHFLLLLTHTAPPAGEAAILDFEQIIGSALPPDYRNFLSISNGGFIPWGGNGPRLLYDGPRYASVSTVFGLREEGAFSLIERNALGVPLPPSFFGIMDDGDGNLICLGGSGETYGEIHVREGGDIYRLATSFSEFILRLRNIG